jgi:hypothetical protein
LSAQTYVIARTPATVAGDRILRMSRRSRIAAFGSAAVLVVLGVVCAIVVGGTAGPILAFVLIGMGLILATSLVFLEVGLSEDHERDRERKVLQRRRPSGPRRPRLDRSRSHRRRLR